MPRSRTARRLPLATTVVAFLALLCVGLDAHDLFFRARAYRITPGREASVDVLSGTFGLSENAIERSRLADLSLAGPAGRRSLDATAWSEAEPQSAVRFTADAQGTYVLGAALHPRLLSLDGRSFNAYLREEGLEPMLERRRAQKRLEEPSRERYSKYVKAVLQAGAETSPAWATVLGYAAEIVPEANPYDLAPGATLVVRCLVHGQPATTQVVFAGGRASGTGRRLPPQRLTTDADGRVTVRLATSGTYYVKFVSMREVADPDANYESLWSTLSFSIGDRPR